MNDKHRLFIAVNFPSEIKERLVDVSRKWCDLPVRWAKKDNIHLTLAFLGYVSNEGIIELSKGLKKISFEHSSFLTGLKKISLGSIKNGVPKLIWAEVERSKELISLKENLDDILSRSIGYIPDKREFFPHITLGRVRKWDWQKMDPEEVPDIEKDISWDFEVYSIEMMESYLKRSGAEYIILESFPFKKL